MTDAAEGRATLLAEQLDAERARGADLAVRVAAVESERDAERAKTWWDKLRGK